MIKLGCMVLKAVSWVHNDKIGANGLERSQLGRQYKVNWVQNDKIRSYGLRKESIEYTMLKLGQIS